MKAFVAPCFLALALGYWAASGGAGFVPEAWPEEAAATPAIAAAPDVAVTRAEAPTEALVAPPPATTEAPLGAAADPLAGAALDPLAALAEIAPALTVEAGAAETLVASSAGAAGGERRRVTGDRVNLREGPGTAFAVVARLERGSTAEVVARDGGWAHVRADGAEGWIAGRFLAGLDG